MSSSPVGSQSTRFVQDGPPKDGFLPVRYRKIQAPRKIGGALSFVIAVGIMGFGFYRMGQGNIEGRALKQEKINARKDLVPLLQAEEDIRFVIEKRARLEEEKEIMKNVEGWVPGESVYNTKRFVPPTSSTSC